MHTRRSDPVTLSIGGGVKAAADPKTPPFLTYMNRILTIEDLQEAHRTLREACERAALALLSNPDSGSTPSETSVEQSLEEAR